MEIRNLGKTINQKQILKNINLDIPKGIIYGIVGRNGSGKTTLFRTIASHYLMDEGKILIDQQDINQETYLKNDIFYLDTQFRYLDPLNPKQISKYLGLIYPLFDNGTFERLVAQYELPNQRFHTYSKGMQALMVIILALCSNCSYVILDEPLDGLDVIVRKQVRDLMFDMIDGQERTIILASHNLNELEKLVDQIAFIRDHTIVSTFSLEDEKENARKLQLVFQNEKIPAEVMTAGKILNIQGRVVTALFEQYDASLKEMLLQHQPLLMEELPITLEDLFLSKFSNKVL